MDGINFVKIAAYIGAAFTMGIGTFGPALSQGSIARQACESIGKYPDSANNVRLTMMIALGLVESLAIYCLLIAILLIFIS
jgi:F-type H+-transporting ATPase subunit c